MNCAVGDSTVHQPVLETSAAGRTITEKDRVDVEYAVEHQLDYIAASFIRRRTDIEQLRELLMSLGGDDVNVIAKLEKPQAIDNLEEILSVSDGVMVARGDLGVELPPEAVPMVQKRILNEASRWGRFAITATQMLESMTTNARPTRAEASDVANAIFDGSDAVMLSAETASGRYPVESVQMMARIISAAEHDQRLYSLQRPAFRKTSESDEFTDALAGAMTAIDARRRLRPATARESGHGRATLRRIVTSRTPATVRWIRASAALVLALAWAAARGMKDSASTVTPSAVQMRMAYRV